VSINQHVVTHICLCGLYCAGHVVLSAASVAESKDFAADLMPARLTVFFSCCVVFVSVWNAVK